MPCKYMLGSLIMKAPIRAFAGLLASRPILKDSKLPQLLTSSEKPSSHSILDDTTTSKCRRGRCCSMGGRGIVRKWVDSAVRLPPPSSIRTHGWHSCMNEGFPESLNTCSSQHVMSGNLLCREGFMTCVQQAFTVKTLLPMKQLLLVMGTLPGFVLEVRGQHQGLQSCEPFRCLHHCFGPVPEEVVLIIRLRDYSQVQLACLLYPLQCPFPSCAAKRPSGLAWQTEL